MPPSAQTAVRVGVPLAAALGAVILAHYFIAPGVDLDRMARGLAGPGTWPKVMLYCAGLTALAICVRGAFARQRDADDGPGYQDGKLCCGIAVLLGYGLAIPLIGMAWATLLFIAGWLWLSGLRRPLPLILVSTLGTAGILYVFVKVSLMPLERGRGVFEEATIALYQLLGIY